MTAQIQLRVGELFLNQYEVFATIRGQKGPVAFVENKLDKNRYVVKSIYTSNNQLIDNFLREIEVSFSIPPHPNIAQPQFVEVVNGIPFLFIDYVRGDNLRNLVGFLTVPQIIDIAYQLVSCMEFLHTQKEFNVVHADIKPENILISTTGAIKIIDFGVSRYWSFTKGIFSAQSQGSLPYMSPEQLNNNVLDEHSDIFSFGILFYEMLTGKLPYPFIKNRKRENIIWEKELFWFYENMPSISTIDDYTHTPWRQIKTKGVNEDLKHLILTCIFPSRKNRWSSFSAIKHRIENKFGNFIKYCESNCLFQDDSNYLHKYANALSKIGRLEKSADIFNLVLKKEPNDPRIWIDAALTLKVLHKYEAAQQCFLRAVELDSSLSTKFAHFLST